ncbi:MULTISPECIES: hypothetical protein [unclassified Streptomyces]|uniref:hypothetical protein n=1 Tax=unclassified Streptomyces TaxID=2593676 RepID=UPI00081B95E0|nr:MULTISPECIES: hypothetical protein [unclassified Streptomyces]MYQ86787.1 hypothetical protein [Streptomyces sp. SID4936]SCE33873.1 hypothetical protein GA0115234_108113 [Streptomyces sp. DvalAA-43]
MSNKLLQPDGWLVLGLPWPEQAQDGWGECALAIAPQTSPRRLVSKEAGTALDLAGDLAREPGDGPGKAVFFSDVTLWLDKQGKSWGALGIDHEAVIDELVKAQVPQLYMTLSRKAHAILCDASREGLRLHYAGGDVEHVTPQVRADVHAAVAMILERDWPVHIQDLVDRGATQIK